MLFYARKSGTVILKPNKIILSREGDRVLQEGLKVKFINNNFQTEDEETIKQIKASRYYGVLYWALDDTEPAKPSEAGQQILETAQQASEDTTRACPHCSSNFESKAAMASHIRFKHPDKVTPKS